MSGCANLGNERWPRHGPVDDAVCIRLESLWIIRNTSSFSSMLSVLPRYYVEFIAE